jgi:hypothetical protein
MYNYEILTRFETCYRRTRKVMILFSAVAMRCRVNINGPSYVTYVNRERKSGMRESGEEKRYAKVVLADFRSRLNRGI